MIAPRAFVASVAVFAFACTSQAKPTPTDTPSQRSGQGQGQGADPCPEFEDARRVATVHGSPLAEISGIEASERSDVLWVHEDSGAAPEIHAVDLEGRVVGTVRVEHAEHVDWEDIALADGDIWVGDIGDNAAARSDIQVYWFPEPEPTSGSIDAQVTTLTYEDGPHDAEALVVDEAADALFVITKELSLASGDVYTTSIEGLRDGDHRELTRVGTVPIGIVTAADLGDDGLVVKNYSKARLFPWTSERTVEAAIEDDGCPVPLGGGESVTFRDGDGSLYAIPEGSDAPIWVTEPAR